MAKKKSNKPQYASYGECLHILKSKNITKCGIKNRWKVVSDLKPQDIKKWKLFYCMECFPKNRHKLV